MLAGTSSSEKTGQQESFLTHDLYRSNAQDAMGHDFL